MPNCEEIKFESISLLARVYEKMVCIMFLCNFKKDNFFCYFVQNDTATAKEILRKVVDESRHVVYWHIKILFQLAVSIFILPK